MVQKAHTKYTAQVKTRHRL